MQMRNEMPASAKVTCNQMQETTKKKESKEMN